MRIFLKAERIDYVFISPLPQSHAASDDDQSAYKKHLDDNEMAGCIMLASKSLELQ